MESLCETLAVQSIETVYGRYVVLMQRDGDLVPEAETVLRRAVYRSRADCLYADAAVQTARGHRPIYKPAFSPDTLLSYNYVGSPLVLSEGLYQRVCADVSLPQTEADRLYLLSVRALLMAERVEHVPHILFCGTEPAVPTACDAVTWAMSALDRQGAVGQGTLFGSFAVRYSPKQHGGLSVIVRNNGDADALRRTLEGFELRCGCTEQEFLVAAGGLFSERERRYCAMLEKYRAAKICYVAGETNDARIKNLAAAQAGGEYLLFVEAGTEPDCADAAERMIAHAQQRRVGAVGGVIRAEDGTLLQSEMRIDAENRPVMRRTVQDMSLPASSTQTVSDACIRNVTLLGAGAFLLRTDVFLEYGGFDETFDSCFAEAALSLSLAQRQRYNVCTPYARFIRMGTRRASLSRRCGERCSDMFRALRVHGDPLVSQNAAYLAAVRAERNG